MHLLDEVMARVVWCIDKESQKREDRGRKRGREGVQKNLSHSICSSCSDSDSDSGSGSGITVRMGIVEGSASLSTCAITTPPEDRAAYSSGYV